MAEEINLGEYILVQKQLCPVIFETDSAVFSPVCEGLLRIADFWWQGAHKMFPDFKLKEVVLYGDLAGYVYNQQSEVSLGIMAEIPEEYLPYLDMINATFVTTELKYTFINRPVHCRFVHQMPAGVPCYSLSQSKWLCEPQHHEFVFSTDELCQAFGEYQQKVHAYVAALPKIDGSFLTIESCHSFERYVAELQQAGSSACGKNPMHEYSLDYLLWRTFKDINGFEYFNSYLSDSINYNVNVLEKC